MPDFAYRKRESFISKSHFKAVKRVRPYEDPVIQVIALYRFGFCPGHCHAYPH